MAEQEGPTTPIEDEAAAAARTTQDTVVDSFTGARDDTSGTPRENTSKTSETKTDSELAETFEGPASGEHPVIPPVSDELEGAPPPPGTTPEAFEDAAIGTNQEVITRTDPNTGRTETTTRPTAQRRGKFVQQEREPPGVGHMFMLLISHIFDLFDSNKRGHAIRMLEALFPASRRSKDPAMQQRYETLVRAGDSPEGEDRRRIESSTVEEIIEEFDPASILNQKSLLRPDLLAAVTGTDAESVRKRGILNDIITAVEKYNETAAVKLDPYIHANQLWQESVRFTENPNNTLDASVIGFAQMKEATVNHFLSQNHPAAQAAREAIGKSSVTESDLRNRELAIELSVHLMGYETQRHGSQFAALFIYNAGEGRPGEGVISRIQTKLGIDRDPTIAEIVEFYQEDRKRVDQNFENGVYDSHAEGADRRWSSTWAVESFEYSLLAYSPLWSALPTLENPHQDVIKNGEPFTEADARAKMTAIGLPLPQESDAEAATVEAAPTPGTTP